MFIKIVRISASGECFAARVALVVVVVRVLVLPLPSLADGGTDRIAMSRIYMRRCSSCTFVLTLLLAPAESFVLLASPAPKTACGKLFGRRILQPSASAASGEDGEADEEDKSWDIDSAWRKSWRQRLEALATSDVADPTLADAEVWRAEVQVLEARKGVPPLTNSQTLHCFFPDCSIRIFKAAQMEAATQLEAAQQQKEQLQKDMQLRDAIGGGAFGVAFIALQQIAHDGSGDLSESSPLLLLALFVPPLLARGSFQLLQDWRSRQRALTRDDCDESR